MAKKIIIAIDGYSSCGKSTLAKRLSKELGYVYVDTGAMYRAITLLFKQNNIVTNNVEQVTSALKDAQLSFRIDEQTGAQETCLNGINVESEIRTMTISQAVSHVSQLKPVRTAMVEQQRSMGIDKGIVMDGRDIGTVVFPEAELKIFMTAEQNTRALRRFKELIRKGYEVTYEEVLENLIQRDLEDSNRVESPLQKAPDAYVLDNTDMTPDEQFLYALELVKQKTNV